jgi:hypothetical protein
MTRNRKENLGRQTHCLAGGKDAPENVLSVGRWWALRQEGLGIEIVGASLGLLEELRTGEGRIPLAKRLSGVP